jgi:hypothetical protein
MRNTTAAAVLVIFASLSQARPTSAQEVRGFAGAGVMSDLNDDRFPAFGGGVLFDLPTSWLTAGAQGEMFLSWPYVAGRGAVFGQVNPVRRGVVRPVFLAGYGFGLSEGPMIGGGVELRLPHRRIGLRAIVEDYMARVDGFDCVSLGYSPSYCDAGLRGGRPYTEHQITVRIGLLF